MCGRFTLTENLEALVERFDIQSPLNFEYQPRYNIAPSQSVIAVINNEGLSIMGLLTWGLIPSWSKEKSPYKMINARAETLAVKPSFKNLFKNRRCLIPADGFYEWKKENDKKSPYRIKMKDSKLFAMAGLWDGWVSPAGETIYTCTIVTTEANELIKPIHNRMPLILPREKEQLWLDSTIDAFNVFTDILKPYPANELHYYPVSSMVNSPKNDLPDNILPVK